MTSAAEHRRLTFARGRCAEALALACLILKGYRPLARRFSASGGEIDLIVARAGTIAFVEVKARPRSITPAKRSARRSGAGSRARCEPGWHATPGR